MKSTTTNQPWPTKQCSQPKNFAEPMAALEDICAFMRKVEWEPILLKCLQTAITKNEATPINKRERMAILILIQKMNNLEKIKTAITRCFLEEASDR